VDGVTNHEPAAGGAEQETLENVKERGPKALRHRNRAVTTQDFEDLAYEASSNVARVRAIVPHYDSIRSQWTPPYNAGDAGRVGLIIVPHSPDIPPTPSLELIDRIEEYILTRAAPTLDLWIAGPDWVRVTVDAQIAPVSFEAADTLVETVATAVQRFLHPLTGGSTGNGWAFGRKPHRSDLYALLESIEGVDHVRALQVTEEEMGAVRPDRFLVFSGMHTISLVSPQEGA
jgi:predicted phage baseplate assembly protein